MSVQLNDVASHDAPMNAIPNRPFPLKRIVGVLLSIAVITAALAVVLPKSANAKDVIGLDAEQMASVQAMQDYFNAMTTLKTRFMQVTSQGQFAQGEILISRPGRMRIEYDPPESLLIVSNGLILMFKDRELDQISHVPLATTPASIFLRDNLNFFGEDLLITDFTAETGTQRLTVQRSADPHEGSLTFVFESKPLQLRKWVVRDAQGIDTTVSLLGTQFGEVFKDELFKVENKPFKPTER